MIFFCLWQPGETNNHFVIKERIESDPSLPVTAWSFWHKNEKSDRSLPSSLERPVFNDSEAINLTFGLTLQQIIDVVSPPPYHHHHHHHHPHHLTLADYRCCESSISSSNIFIRNTLIDFSNLLFLLQQYYLWHHVFVHNIVLILTFPSMKSCEAFHPEFRTHIASCKSGSQRGEDLLLQPVPLHHFKLLPLSIIGRKLSPSYWPCCRYFWRPDPISQYFTADNMEWNKRQAAPVRLSGLTLTKYFLSFQNLFP